MPTTCGSSAPPIAAGADLLGFYHSHPDHPARPSQYDLDHALPNLLVRDRVGDCPATPGDMRSWKLRDDRSAFDEEALSSILHSSISIVNP